MEENVLLKISFIRGHSNRFFYVERELSSETDSIFVIVLKFRKKENNVSLKPRPIYTSTTGKILAMELDQVFQKETDSYWTYGQELITGKEILNQLFVLDS